MKLFSYRGNSILDPFNGAGTTTLVAAKLGRKFIGIDLSPEYCQMALARLEGLSEENQGNDEKKALHPLQKMLVWGEG
jgi:site-specific DNA-methyltransferase (adenine-specific)